MLLQANGTKPVGGNIFLRWSVVTQLHAWPRSAASICRQTLELIPELSGFVSIILPDLAKQS